jgi:hypothetical protein
MPATSPPKGSTHRLRRAIVAATLGLLAHAAVSRAEPEGGDVLAYAAEIRAMVEVCREETPAVTAHLGQAYSSWLEHNPIVSEALHALTFGPDPARMAMRSAAYEERKRRETAALQREFEADPEGLSARCEHFIKDLGTGELDYPAPVASPRRE